MTNKDTGKVITCPSNCYVPFVVAGKQDDDGSHEPVPALIFDESDSDIPKTFGRRKMKVVDAAPGPHDDIELFGDFEDDPDGGHADSDADSEPEVLDVVRDHFKNKLVNRVFITR